ncbi:MAG: penicillin-binding protein 2 [Paracoccaceae bacterium]|jgi:cell division protein FtsI (penicillin-binding protein 3)|nr:penicillin-binding protein 2 [Paracoccaceae bacterium]MDP7185566.1 penicillin-binding protein 2 [Paracoccaceae bacterium]
MIRKPLRPLALVLEARAAGQNPKDIERENIRARQEQARDASRSRAESRLLVLLLTFLSLFGLVAFQMGVLALSDASEPTSSYSGPSIVAQRGNIVDREGRILATNIDTYSLYATPQDMVDPEMAAKGLVEIFPELEEQDLLRWFTGKRKFLWVKKKLSPEQKQAVQDLGEPGLKFGPRELRLYPNGSLAAHVLGGASFGREDVAAAEVVGVAGVEKTFDDFLRDPARAGEPLQLTIDLSIQSAVERVLQGGMTLMNAKGAAAILMDVNTGEIVSLVSLPDFDPNERPPLPTSGSPTDSPLFNRAVQGVYELGSTFKIFAAAQAIDLGLVTPDTMIDIRGPLKWGKFRITDFKNYGNELSVYDIIKKSSNIGTARLALQIGAERQQDFLRALGFDEKTSVEMVEAKGGKPKWPSDWQDISTITVSYGHGISVTPMHLAAGYATLANGGYRVTPTLLKQDYPQRGPRVISPETSRQVREMLRAVVKEGTATFGDVEGYAVGGKTGTADKAKENGGGYYEDRVISTFASVFPAYDPKYVLIVTMDEPELATEIEPKRTAGWTAVPIAAEIITRVAPLLGLRPEIEPKPQTGVTGASN